MANFSKNTRFVVRGFTLIELLVVIGILTVVVALLISVLDPLAQFRKSRDSRRKSDMREMKTSLMLYRNTCDTYPANNASNQIVGCGATCGAGACAWGSQWSVNGNIIMKTLPKDPSNTGSYTYKYSSNGGGGSEFCLWTTLENRFDDAAQKSQNQCSSCNRTGNEYVVCED